MPEETFSMPSEEDLPKAISVDYLKSQGYRVIKVDGAIGGISQRGEFMMSLWNERVPIPQHVSYAVTENGKLGTEIPAERVGRGGLVREVEFSASMSLNVAESIATWIQKHVREFKEAIAKTNEAGVDNLKKDGTT
ncbi:MAG: hypothetical protein WD069_09515 [Planctomycetales bacterium]